MHKKKINSFNILLIVSLFVISTIIGGVILASSVLEEEAVDSNVRVVKLQADTFSEQLSQTIYSIELIINNLERVIKNEQNFLTLEKRFSEILKNNPHIRSLNLLEDNRVMLSSKKENLNTSFDVSSFYPNPFFNDTILRVGHVFVGRDIGSIIPLDTTKAIIKEHTFIPLSKRIYVKDKSFVLVVSLNPDYFINKFSSKLQKESHFDLVRLDDLILATTDENSKIGIKTQSNPLLLSSKEKNSASGVSFLNQKEYILSYSLTNNYPFYIIVRTPYKESLKAWESKRYDFFIITTAIVVVCVLLVLYILFLYISKYKEEIKRHKLQIKNQKKFQVLFQTNRFLAAIVNMQGIIKEINQEALNLLNKPYEEVVHTTFWELLCFSEHDKQWLQDTILNYEESQDIIKELSIINASGELLIIELKILPIKTEGTIELVLLSSDITERKRYEYKIKEAYTVFQNTKDGIVITDKNAFILNANKAFETCSGYALEEVLNKNLNILKSGVHDKEFYKKFWEALTKNGIWEGELINKNKDGELWSEWLTVNAVLNQESQVQNYIGIFHDTTEQKRQEKEIKEKEDILMQQAKMASMGEMIENIAHQWRQPLSVISTIATGIQLKHEYGVFDEKEVLEELKSINASAQFLSHTIDDFRSFMLKDKVKKIFKLTSAIEKSLNIIKSKFKNREINIITHIEDVECNGFENQLMQVFLNLLNNAKDAFETRNISERYVFIDAYKQEDKIIILFKDNASGISQNIVDKIFDPYFTTKHQSQGTGIGLYMSKQIVQNHLEGNLSVSNEVFEYNNKTYNGACFKIVLKV